MLTLLDPDGLRLELVARAEADTRPPWLGGPVPAEHAIRGFEGVTLTEWNPEVTAGVLVDTLGFRKAAEEKGRIRFETGAGGHGARVDVLASPTAPRGHISAGTVHHVAWRAADEQDQLAWREAVEGAGLYVTPVLDRQYFRSIYFREPGGVLFEIATDPPGFTRDEPVESLGSALKLPPWLEPERQQIEAVLPPLRCARPRWREALRERPSRCGSSSGPAPGGGWPAPLGGGGGHGDDARPRRHGGEHPELADEFGTGGLRLPGPPGGGLLLVSV